MTTMLWLLGMMFLASWDVALLQPYLSPRPLLPSQWTPTQKGLRPEQIPGYNRHVAPRYIPKPTKDETPKP